MYDVYSRSFCFGLFSSIFNNLLVDLPEIKGNHRKFRTLVSSYIGNELKLTIFEQKKNNSLASRFSAVQLSKAMFEFF